MWIHRRRAYIVEEHTARDLAALAQVRRMEVIVTAVEPEPAPVSTSSEIAETETETLW